MISSLAASGSKSVALLAEGVDRNQNIGLIFVKKNTSPSSRRAWIEISSHSPLRNLQKVALLAEGVDRNTAALPRCRAVAGRPPRGGRG